ncbi:hypothetical protein [Halomonas smyrnensis]|uniref:hypothetical protein n=1 Tax=Halomonas smyrnensis TaxID=720605 RepID=UPI00059136D5|nr:hypothetical protein [Halomonas smyrnensis]
MSEVTQSGSQLDRIETSIGDLRQLNAQILDRLTRMEERQNTHATEMGKLEARVDDHSDRIRELELQVAVASKTGKQQHRTLMGRWAALASVAMLLLGAAASTVGKVLADLLTTGAQ